MSDREELTRTVLRVEAERAAKDAAWSRPRTHPMQNMQPSVARLFELANYRPPAAPSVDPAWAHGRAMQKANGTHEKIALARSFGHFFCAIGALGFVETAALLPFVELSKTGPAGFGLALLACLSSIATCASAQLGEWAVEKALWVVAND